MQVTSYSLSLNEIDTVRGSKGMITSAIEIMVRKGHVKILSDPLVKTLITTKWDRFASMQFLMHAFLYLAFVIAQTFLVWLHSSSGQWNQNSREVGPGLYLQFLLHVFIQSLVLPFLLTFCIYQYADKCPCSCPLPSMAGTGDCVHHLCLSLPAAGAAGPAHVDSASVPPERPSEGKHKICSAHVPNPRRVIIETAGDEDLY